MRRILLVSVSVAGLIIGLSPLPSQAGFEWTPPTSMPRSVATAPAMEPQQLQGSNGLSNAGPLTPEPVLRAPVPSIEPVSSDMLDDDMPPPPPSRSAILDRDALPSAVDTPQILAPKNNFSNNSATQPQVFVPTMTQNSRVDGFGRRIPLSIALKQIVPNNYVYKFDEGVTPKTKVSWQGGDTWVNVLNEMLDSSNLSGRLDGNVIRISKGAGDIVMLPQPSSGRTTMLMPTSQESLMGQGVGQNTSRAIVDLQTRRNWSAASGATLRDALSSWAREAGVQLEWQSNVNYPVNSTFNFEGTFDQAVDSLLSLYGDEGSAPKGKLYPNKPNGPSVLVVDSL